MRTCPKCSKQASDESKICRDCGAILDDIPDVSVPVAAPQPEASVESGPPLAAESQVAEPSTGEKEPVAEVQVTWDEPVPPAQSEASPWKCPQCGETVPGTFDVCWKCLTTKDGEKPEQSQAEFLQRIADGGKPDEEPESTELYAGALGMEKDAGERPQSACPRCGSSKMMFGVTVQDQGDNSDGRLQMVVFGAPSALIFKDRLFGELTADICGDCGHVELRVTNAGELYRHYRKSME
jgi:hypothetical protein